MNKILIIDDDRELCALIKRSVQAENIEADFCNTGKEGLQKLREQEYQLVVLDVMMPGMDGFETLEEIRKENSLPILMFTSKNDSISKVRGLRAGADDYLPKPFEPDELICRVRAMLRRGGTYQPTVLAFGDVTLDPGSGVLTCCGRSVRLSGREFQVMELFLRSPQVVLSADRIMERVWGWDSEAEINVVWVHISNLRKKLRSIGSHVTIRASRGLGYLLEVEV